MLEVKLGEGKTFTAMGIDERYTPKTDYNPASYTLSFEISPVNKELEEYINMFATPTSIEVREEEDLVATYTGYNTITEAYIRIAPDAQRTAFISLNKTINK